MKSWLPILSMIAGACIPAAADATFLVRYSVMVMLFMSFLHVKPEWSLFRWSHLWLLGLNILSAVGWYLAVAWWNEDLALLAFLCGIMPTAAVSPVLAGIFKRSIGYVTLALLLSNLVMALSIPLLLPLLGIQGITLTTSDLLLPVAITVLVPMILAQSIRIFSAAAFNWLIKWKNITFWLFIGNVFIAMAKASDYIIREASSWEILLMAFGIIVMITAANFLFGYLIEKKSFRQEASLALGRKNTMFGVWLAVTYLPPLAVLGPIGYVITHNLWHSFLMSRQK